MLGPDGAFGMLDSSKEVIGFAVHPKTSTVVAKCNDCRRLSSRACTRDVRGGVRLPVLSGRSGILAFRLISSGMLRLGCFVRGSLGNGRLGY